MLPSCILQILIDGQTEVAITVNDGGTLNTIAPCKVQQQDGDLVRFLYIKTGNDMVYVYHREDIKQIRYEVAT